MFATELGPHDYERLARRLGRDGAIAAGRSVRLIAGRRSATIGPMGLIQRLREWLRGGTDHDEISEAALRGSPAGGMGHRHPASDVLPPDDRGVEGGAPSHDDPLGPSVR